jgi:predicted AAA+ superfamily ATPase
LPAGWNNITFNSDAKAFQLMSGKPTDFLFPKLQLNDALVADLRRMNPWWEGKPGKQLPKTQRHLVGQILRRLEKRMAPIVVVRGPRQVGKTTAQLQLIEHLLKQQWQPTHILRVQCDEIPGLMGLSEPILRLIEWFEASILGKTLNESAKDGKPTLLVFDEVQNLPDRAPQLKHLVDHTTTQVLVTGSSALRIEKGRDSLAGRISTLECGTLSLTEIAHFRGLGNLGPFLPDNGLGELLQRDFWINLIKFGQRHREIRDASYAAFSERGGYPLCHERVNLEWPTLADQLNETVIKRVILHDLRVGEKGRKRDQTLLEELFRLCCRYIGQTPDIQTLVRELQRALNANVGSVRVRSYLKFLGDTLLLRLVEPMEIRLKKKRGAPKICLADHGLRASWLQEVVPLDLKQLQKHEHLGTLAGHIAESVVGALLGAIHGLDVAHFPNRSGEPEIDFVLSIGTTRLPMEVKYQRTIDPFQDTEGLRSFLEKTVNNAPFGLLITQTEISLQDPRIIAVPLSTLLLLR